jgi:hypothetical protein
VAVRTVCHWVGTEKDGRNFGCVRPNAVWKSRYHNSRYRNSRYLNSRYLNSRNLNSRYPNSRFEQAKCQQNFARKWTKFSNEHSRCLSLSTNQKIPSFYGTRRFIVLSTSSCLPFVSCPDQYRTSFPQRNSF